MDNSPEGYEYLHEVELVQDVIEAWSLRGDYRAPTAAVVHNAEHDAYQPVE